MLISGAVFSAGPHADRSVISAFSVGVLQGESEVRQLLGKIKKAFDETKQALGVPDGRDWLKGYYQYCNRIAILYFLNKQGVPAHLLYIYFLGDKHEGKTCPQHEEEWLEALQAQDEHVGLPQGHKLETQMHKLFLPVVL